MHHDNFSEEGVSILAIEGYGEGEEGQGGEEDGKEGEDGKEAIKKEAAVNSINFRGQRKFGSGGVSLACSRCCSTLGYASTESPESFRLFKHRLGGSEQLKSYSVGFFVARELVKYCESQAVYVFVAESPSKEQRIVLKVLSWDSKFRSNHDESFFPALKLLWGLEDKLEGGGHGEGHGEGGGMGGNDGGGTLFGWADICCAPDVKKNKNKGKATNIESNSKKAASVKIFLQADEFDQLINGLKIGKEFFPKNVASASLLMENISLANAEDVCGLSLLPLVSKDGF